MEKGVTDASQQCLGLPQYCSEEIAELIESLDGYIKKDYAALIKKLEWLFDTNRKKTELHRGDLEDLIHSWRKKEITDLEKFSLYQREYTTVAAPLKAAGHLTEKDFNIGLWAGLHEGTRDRLERRIMTKNTQRDIKNPFEEAEIEEAAAHIFDRDRFDKHLREGQKSHRRIFEDRSSKRRRNRKRRQYESDSDTDSESDKSSESEDEKEETPRWTKHKSTRKTKEATISKPEVTKKKTEKDEITELVSKLEGMTIRDSTYRPTYVHLSMLAPHIAELYEKPEVRPARSYQAQGPMPPLNPSAWRDPPPHQQRPPRDQRFNERREPTCYGCNEQGHRMDQCGKIEAFITQGHVRRIEGRLRWADGSSISREPDESWVKAILRRIQHENQSMATGDNGRSKGVYFVEVAREDSDADTDYQAEMGWMSGVAKVDHLQSYSVDRPSRVTKEFRKGSASNVPPSSHRVKEFSRSNREGPDRKKHSVAFDANHDDRQNRLQKIPAPTARHVSPIILKRELDIDTIPMDVDKPGPTKVLDDVRKMAARGKEGTSRDISQPRTKKHRVEQEVIDELMKAPVTLSFQKVARISPRVRRDLAGALKAMKDSNMDNSEDEHLKIETKAASEDLGKRVRSMRAEWRTEDFSEDLLDNLDLREARAELLKLEATVGEATMKGIVDTGSMVSMISATMAEESGLPSEPLRRRPFKVIGVNGVTSVCRSKIPKAKIYLTSEKHETESDLYVLDQADFDLLLGRPWGTYNGVGIDERVRGTYVSYITDKSRYEVNASKAHAVPVRIGRADMKFCHRREDSDSSSEEEESAAEVLTARIIRNGTDRSYVPDSEEDRLGPDYIKDETDSEDDRSKVKRADRRVKEAIAEWQRERGEEADDEEEGREKESNEWTPPPNQLDKGKRKASEITKESSESEETPRKARKRTRGKIIEVDEDMEEEFITMTQDDVDEEEWEEFYAREGRRLSKNNEQWVRWLEESEVGDNTSIVVDDEGLHTPISPKGLSSVEEPPVSSPEPSHTLRSQPKKVGKTEPAPRTRRTTAEKAVRRSHRLRQSTRCELCNEDLVPRVRKYERKYKISREVTKRAHHTPTVQDTPEDLDELPILSLCTRIILDDNETTDTKDRMENNQNDDQKERQGPAVDNPVTALVNQETRNEGDLTYGTVRPLPRAPQEQSRVLRRRIVRPTLPRDDEGPVTTKRSRGVIPRDRYEREGDEFSRPLSKLFSRRRTRGQSGLTQDDLEAGRLAPSDTEIRQHQPRPQEPTLRELNKWWERKAETEQKASEERKGHEEMTDGREWRHNDEGESQMAGTRAEADDDDSDDSETNSSAQIPGDLGYELREVVTHGGVARQEDQSANDPSTRILREWLEQTILNKESPDEDTKGDTLPIDNNRMARTDRMMAKGRNGNESGTVRPEGSPKHDADELRRNGIRSVSTTPTPEESCKQGRVSSGDEERDIKDQKGEQHNIHLPNWPYKHLLLSKLLKPICKVLISLLALLFVLLIISTLRTNKEPTKLTMTYQTIDLREDSSSDSSQYPGRPYTLSDGHVPRAGNLDHPTSNEVAESVLQSISTPQDDKYTPGIVAIQHLVPLVVTSSHRVQEYLGKAATVTFHSTKRGKVTIQGDVHLRIVEQGIVNGWGRVDCPSPAEVHLLQGVLFREPLYKGEMDQLNCNYEGGRKWKEALTTEAIPIKDNGPNR